MAQQLAQGYRALAGLGKFWPVASDRCIQRQLAFGHQLQGGDGGEGFCAGEQVGDGIAVPGLLAVLVGGAGPQVEDRFATDLDAQCGAAFLGIIEKCCEGFAYRLELEFVMTLNLHP